MGEGLCANSLIVILSAFSSLLQLQLLNAPDDLRITAEAPFEFNVLRQRVEDLDGGPVKAQTHLSDVPTQPFAEVCLDGAMTGVGGYDSWGAWPESSRTLWTDRSYQYNFTLIPSR